MLLLFLGFVWVAPSFLIVAREHLLATIIVGILLLITIVLFLGWAIFKGKD